MFMDQLTHCVLRFCSVVCLSLALTASVTAQDNILVYGNSILAGDAVSYLSDIVTQGGAPTPNIVTYIIGNGTTSNYLSNSGLIVSGIPAGQTWKAMIVQGGTVETTTNFGDPVAFQSNMLALAAALFAHSPQAQFIGHETGADHPDSVRYPAWFPDAAAWLAFPQAAYRQAQINISTANPTSPRARTARQGTTFANTAGYPLSLYLSDLHHLSQRGKVLSALLHYIEIYGGRVCDMNVDFSVSTHLVNRLLADGINEAAWNRLASFADRSQPRRARSYPGSDSDFQLRTVVNASLTNLCPRKQGVAGDVLKIQLVSPLDATTNFRAVLYSEILPTGVQPGTGLTPGLQLDRALLRILFSLNDLTGPEVLINIPSGLSGMSLWLQAASRGPSGSSSFPLTLSDAQVVDIL